MFQSPKSGEFYQMRLKEYFRKSNKLRFNPLNRGNSNQIHQRKQFGINL